LGHIFTAGTLLLAGCAHYPPNARLTHYDPEGGYRVNTLTNAENSGSLQVILIFSGGGMRAAALSYGVLEELARADIVWEGQHRRLLDEVDMISSVSGGSFTAAYYAIYHDGIFRDYEQKFLKQNIQGKLYWRLCSPLNWFRLASPYFARSDLAAEFYDRYCFGGKSFGDLTSANRPPYLILNATDMSSGARFEFTQDQFDLICSDISSVPVARGVAASSAFPVLLSPITVNNYAGSCGYVEPAWVETALTNRQELPRRIVKAKQLRAYQDSTHRPYLHLLDGGLSDNLGLRGLLENTIALGGARSAMRHYNLEKPRKVVVIVVNAASQGDRGWDKHKQSPNVVQVVIALGSVPLNRYSFETMQFFRESLKQWERELNSPGFPGDQATTAYPVQFYSIEVSFEALTDPAESNYFDKLPSALNLPAGAVERLRDVAGRLLRESVNYRALLRDLGGEANLKDTKTR
jgi:NTE family protein